MIKKVDLYKFKKFKNEKVELKNTGITVLAGVNNSGKSSLLHAIAVWEFCKTVLQIEKGDECLYENSKVQGFGLSPDEFLPIALPSLKHLWTNLKTQKENEDKDGYTLKIKCCWDLRHKKDCYLEISLSLVNDRLFIKNTASNLTKDDKIPCICQPIFPPHITRKLPHLTETFLPIPKLVGKVKIKEQSSGLDSHPTYGEYKLPTGRLREHVESLTPPPEKQFYHTRGPRL